MLWGTKAVECGVSSQQSNQAYGDVDGNGLSSPMQDGQVVYRYLLGLQGQDLIQGVVDPTTPRHTPEQVERFLSTIESPTALVGGKDLSALNPLSDVSSISETPSFDQNRDSLSNNGETVKRPSCRKVRKPQRGPLTQEGPP